MPKNEFITASEIAEYVYCNRAWWLKLKGFASSNTENLARGTVPHIQYSQQVEQVARSEGLGKRLLLIGIALLILFVVIRLLIP